MRKNLDIGGTLSSVFDLYGKQAGVLLPAALVVFVPAAIIAAIIGAILGALLLGGVSATMSPADFNAAGEYTGSAGGVLGAIGGAMLIGLIVGGFLYGAGIFYQGLIADSVDDMRDGRRDLSLGGLLSNAGSVAGKLIGLGLLLFLVIVVIAVATMLLTGAVPDLWPVWLVLALVIGVYLFVTWAVAAPAVAIEKIGPAQALGRSRELTGGFFWHVLLILLVIGVITFLVQLVIGVVFGIFGDIGGSIGGAVSGILVAPLAGLTAALMYFQLRGDAAPADGTAVTPPPAGDVSPPPAAPPSAPPPPAGPPAGPSV